MALTQVLGRQRGQRGFTLRLKSCLWRWEKASAQRRPWVRGPDTEAQPPHGTIPEIEVPRGERVARLSWVDQVHLVKSLNDRKVQRLIKLSAGFPWSAPPGALLGLPSVSSDGEVRSLPAGVV